MTPRVTHFRDLPRDEQRRQARALADQIWAEGERKDDEEPTTNSGANHAPIDGDAR